jgi:hypothetical protein
MVDARRANTTTTVRHYEIIMCTKAADKPSGAD